MRYFETRRLIKTVLGFKLKWQEREAAKMHAIAFEEFSFTDRSLVVAIVAANWTDAMGVARHFSGRKRNVPGWMWGDTLDYASFLSRRRQRGEGDSLLPERIRLKLSVVCQILKPKETAAAPTVSRYTSVATAHLARLKQSHEGHEKTETQRVNFAKTQLKIMCPAREINGRSIKKYIA